MRRLLGFGVAAVGAGGAFYLTYALVAWLHYGQSQRRGYPSNPDAPLDRFMPAFDVAERQSLIVEAPAEFVYEAACQVDLMSPAPVRALFRARELLMGSRHETQALPRALLPLMRELGWGVLQEASDRELVAGAITKPWKADVKFEALPPSRFAEFHEPGYAKIVWALGATPLGPSRSLAWTETRVSTTDADSRRRFRRYWAFLSPGILLIRVFTLKSVKRDAERAWYNRHLEGGMTVSDTTNGEQDELLDGTDPLDDPTIEGRLEPKDLDGALDEAARDAEDSGIGGLIDKG